MALASSKLLLKAALIICENSFGKAFPTTEITPSQPAARRGNVSASSPLITMNSFGVTLITLMICSTLPLASLIPMMFLHSKAMRATVSGIIFTAVLPGTLYNTIGILLASLNAL